MNKIKEFFSKRIETVKSAFKKFPISTIFIFIITFMSAFAKELFSNEIFTDIFVIIIYSLFGMVLTETLFPKSKKKYIGIVLSLLIGIGLRTARVKELFSFNILACWRFSYIIIASLLSIYFLSKKSENFEKYTLNTFLNIKRNTIIYGIVCLGIVILYGIFWVLINHIDFDIISKILIIFTGFYYAPVMLDSLTNKEAEDTKFNKTIFSKVLLILLCAAMVIVYIYIFKLLFFTGIPENEVFMILSWIFVALLPICVINKNYCEENKFLKKAIKIIPILFIPFIILQMYTMGIRISNYGITGERYFSIMFMILEIISIAMLLYQNSKYLRELLLVTSLITIIALISPINYEKASILSQENIVKKFASSNVGFDNLEKSEQKKYVGAYQYLSDIKDYEFKIQIDDEEIEKIKSFGNDYDNMLRDEEVVYQDFNAELRDLDISKYSRIEEITKSISNSYESKENEEALKTYIELNNYQTKVDINLNELVNKLIENHKKDTEDSEKVFKECNLLVIDNNKDLYITDLSLDFYKETGKIEYVYLKGYVLEK